MNGFWKSFIVAFALVQVSQSVYLGGGQANPQSLSNLFFRARMASRDPAVTMACFGDYMVKSNDVGEAFSAKYNQCLVDTKDGRKTIEVEMDGQLMGIVGSSHDVCHSMQTCNGLNSTLAIFTCHAEIGANNTKAVYSISGNASEYAGIMHEKYRVIDLKHEQCCKLAERKYVEETAVVYRALQDCLEGRVTPTTAGPPTTTAAPVTTTAAPSTTTTAAPSTTTTTTTQPPTTTTTTTTTTAAPTTTTTTTVPAEPEVTPTSSSRFDTQQIAAQILKLFK